MPGGPPGSHPCGGSVVAGPYSGTLTLVGGPLAPSVVNGVPLTASYSVTAVVVSEPSGAIESSSCLVERGSTATSAGGVFSYAPAVPLASCSNGSSGVSCTDYLGPYGPVSVSPSTAPPAGYAVEGTSTPPLFSLHFVWELASVTVDPAAGSVSTSVGAPTSFSASGRAADGSPSPASVSYLWTLAGTGWELTSGSSGPTAVVVAVLGAGVGTLGVVASTAVDGVSETTPAVTITLTAVATAVLHGQLNRTALDAGGSVALDLEGVGAVGFTYTANIVAGLGTPALAVSCPTVVDGGGGVSFTCATNLSYPSAGIAQPSAVVTNGFSAAAWTFPSVSVDPPPILAVDPAAPVGYPGSPTDVAVVAATGSGTLPYDEACIALGTLVPTCSGAPGPTWTFTLIGPTAGTYSGTAWAIDGAGVNRSVGFSLTVVPRPTVGPIAGLSPNVTVGTAANLSATLSGGALPARFWWNASTSPAPLASGTIAADGAVPLSFAAAVAGPLRLSLVVVDALGGTAFVSASIDVLPPPATRLALLAAPPSTPVTVGTPVDVAWQALTAAGDVDTSFGGAGELEVTSPSGPAPWVNASGVGPLPSLGGGAFGVPASAWLEGVLTLTLVEQAAGPFSLALGGSALPTGPPAAGGIAAPDRDHVALYDPRVVDSGHRANATFWLVRDRYGNPVPGAVLEVEFASGLATSETFVAAGLLANGSSGVWLNFTAPDSGGGTLSVLDAAGLLVLGPIAVPSLSGPPSADPALTALLVAMPAGAALIVVATVVHRRSRHRPSEGPEELQRLAEGRALALGIVERLGAADLRAIESAWDTPPAPPDLADWLASLVADGSIGATIGSDGVARFCSGTPGPSAPRVTVDPDDLDRAMRRRAEALDADEGAP
jgi:hypothetical protein